MSLPWRVRSASPRVTAALIGVCRGTWIDGQLSAAEVDEFLHAVRLHRIAPLAHVVTREPAPEISRRLQPDRDDAFERNLGAAMVLGELGRVLDDLPWVTFKGAALSMSAHPAPGLRTFRDIDALVGPADLRSACERLSSEGWRLLDYDDMLATRPLPGEMHWLSPLGLSIDLHWSMINRQSRRDRFRVPTADLIERRQSVSLGFGEVPTMDGHDALLHVCLHASLDGANRLLQLLDADALARQVVDWSTVARRARAWRAEAPLWLVLTRSRELLGTPVPADLADLLGTRRNLRMLLSFVDRVTPVAATRTEHGVARLVSRAVRSTLVETLAAVSQNAARGIQDRVRPSASIDQRVPAEARTLDAFLADVERTVLSAASSPPV